jgi:hypothetical protein
VRYDEIVPQLLERFPELRPEHERLVQEWFVHEPPGVYNVMDTIWQPFIEGANDEQLSRAFAFVEELCQSEDQEARFVAAEYSWGQFGGTPLLEKIRPFLGQLTRELVSKCEAEWLESRAKRKPSLWRRLTSR